MAGNGYIKIHRKLADWGWYKDANTMRVFMHLLITANYAETEYMGETIHPGETVIGRRSLASALGMSEKNVRTALKHLKSTNEVAIRTTNKFSVVTIVNWELYQIKDGKVANKTANKVASEGPASGHTIKKEEEKNIYGGAAPKKSKGKARELEESYAMAEDWANE